FSALGSASNAFTSYDMTAYFGTVSSDKLEALLVLEADRMRHALIDEAQLESEKRVVISELQGYENSPEYRLSAAVLQQAFPNRPYGLPVGGTKSDVEAFTVEQVRAYYQRYYSPENAVLAVAGDFDPIKLQSLIAQTFGKIPPNPPQPEASSATPETRASESTASSTAARSPIHLKEAGSAAYIEAVYPIPEVQHPDVPVIDVIDAILSVGRNSRFYQTLIEPGLASQANAYSAALIEPGWYDISITLAPDQDLHTVDQTLLDTLQVLQDVPISEAELQRAKTQLMAHFIMSNREVDSQASQLAYSQTIVGDYRHSDRYLAAIQSVTVADVQRVAQTYLKAESRTVGYFEPTQLDDSGELGPVSPQQTLEDFSPGEPVDPAVVAQYLPPIASAPLSETQALPETLTLNNGLRVVLLPDSSSPTVTLSGNIQAGNGYDLSTKGGVASLTAEVLMGGTTRHDALALASRLEDRGAGLDFGSFREGVEIEGHALSQDLDVLLQTLAEILQEATFPESELELARKQLLSGLQLELDDPARLGRRILQQQLYPANHPFHVFATPESVLSITRDDLVSFYRQHYTPANVTLSLVGDFDPQHVRSQLEALLGQWSSPSTPLSLEVPEVALPEKMQRVQIPLPNKTQTVTYLGHPGIRRRDPRFYTALVLNQILGGDTLSSRLGTEIRDRQGLTYGIYSYFAAGQQAGPFVIEMQTAPEDTERAIQSTLALLRQLIQEGVSSAELNTAKRSLINNYPVELANPDVLAQRILTNAVDGFDAAEVRDFPQKVDAVSMEQLHQAIQELLHPDRLLIVTAGPPA
ncbi:MAG TPA: pitrilysin family protein, partial [Stenomitos sp.]